MNKSNILSLPQDNSLESILLDLSLDTVSTWPGKALGEVDCGKGTAEWATGAQDYMEMLTEWGIRGNRKGADGRESHNLFWHNRGIKVLDVLFCFFNKVM